MSFVSKSAHGGGQGAAERDGDDKSSDKRGRRDGRVDDDVESSRDPLDPMRPTTGSPNGGGNTSNGNANGNPSGNSTVTPTGSGDGECLQTDATTCKIELEILRLTNEERAKGRGGLFRQSGSLTAFVNGKKMAVIARLWSEVQAKRGWIGHDGFPGARERQFGQLFTGQEIGMYAENVAMTGGDDEPLAIAKEFFEMWRSSPGHYANMMSDNKAMGVGVAKSGGGWYATEIFGDE